MSQFYNLWMEQNLFTEIIIWKYWFVAVNGNSIKIFASPVFWLILPKTVIPKICSANQWWSARLAGVVRESLYKSIFCPSRTTKFFQVVREPKKFGIPTLRHQVLWNQERGSSPLESRVNSKVKWNRFCLESQMLWLTLKSVLAYFKVPLNHGRPQGIGGQEGALAPLGQAK